MNRWTLRCDRPGCTASVTATAPLLGLYSYAEAQGWQIEPAIAPLRHFCPAHHIGEHDLERPAAVGIWRSA